MLINAMCSCLIRSFPHPLIHSSTRPLTRFDPASARPLIYSFQFRLLNPSLFLSSPRPLIRSFSFQNSS